MCARFVNHAFKFQQFVEKFLMKKFAVNAMALALASVCGSAAFAGAITSPAAAAEVKYAVEALIATTDLTAPAIVYTMGVSRTNAQDFTVIVTPSVGATFTAGSCLTAVPVVTGGGGAATVTQKRSSTTECAYEVDVTTPFTTATTLTFTGLVFDTHTLNVAANKAGVTLALKDLGETAFIDNTGSLSRDVAVSGNAVSYTPTADTGTIANVDDASGPLFGFLPAANGGGTGDTATTTNALVVIGNNTGALFGIADNSRAWNFLQDGTSLTLSFTGNFANKAAAATSVQLALPGFANSPYNVTVSGSTGTVAIAAADFPAGTGNHTGTLTFTTARNASMGTTRVFGTTGVADVVVGADVALAGNAAWWTWSANAIQLSTPYFSTDAGTGVLTRFFFSNSGAAATYSATCTAESGKVVTAGSAATGTLVQGQTVIDAKNVCSFSTGIRGAVTYIINAPAGNIKGTYSLATNGGPTAFLPLQRPYGAATE